MVRTYLKINGEAERDNFEGKREDEEEGVLSVRTTDETLFLTEIISFWSPQLLSILLVYFEMGSKKMNNVLPRPKKRVSPLAKRLRSIIPLRKLEKYFAPYANWKFVLAVIIGYAFLFLTYRISTVAGKLATRFAGPEISDTLFSLFPKYDTSFIHDTLSVAFYYSRNYLLLFFPDRIFFALFSIGILILTRAIFINLTHLGIPAGMHPITSSATFGGDLFFSGHVAYPFLLALIFWDIKPLRYIFLLLSVTFGISAIMGRYHYTIDVVAAPFIAYGVFILCKKLFSALEIPPFASKQKRRPIQQ